MTNPSRRRILRAVMAGLVPPPLREHADGDPPTDDELAATKRAVLAELDAPGRAMDHWELLDALDGVDHYTLRLALEELQAADRVHPAAVFWRPDRCEGDGPPVGGETGDDNAWPPPTATRARRRAWRRPPARSRPPRRP